MSIFINKYSFFFCSKIFELSRKIKETVRKDLSYLVITRLFLLFTKKGELLSRKSNKYDIKGV